VQGYSASSPAERLGREPVGLGIEVFEVVGPHCDTIPRLSLFRLYHSEESSSALEVLPAGFILDPEWRVVPPYIQQVHNLPCGQ
jgi:hypothetical protein